MTIGQKDLTVSDSLQEIAQRAVERQKSEPAHADRLSLPLRVGTRSSPLALVQTRQFITKLTCFCPVLRDMGAFEEKKIKTTGDRVQNKLLADLGGKGLFAKEIHEAVLDGRIDCAVHSLKDLETELPKGLVLACTLKRNDARDALILEPDLATVSPQHPYDSLPQGALIGCASVRRQAQMLHARPDLKFGLLRGNVQTRLDKLAAGQCNGTLLAMAGLKRLGLEKRATIVIPPSVMVPSAGQGIVGVTVRENDTVLRDLLSTVEDHETRAVAIAERAFLAELDGSCHTPIGGYAHVVHPQKEGEEPYLHLIGMVARTDGTFLLKETMTSPVSDAKRLGHALGEELRGKSPPDIFDHS